jgi:hypothetical protein
MSTVPVVLRLLRGAAAGAAATVPMSAVMLGAGRLGLMGEQPPEAITKEAVADATGVEPGGATSDALASLAHIGFGVGAGAVYAALPKPGPAPATVSGMAFGVAVWAASYAGWVPKFGALPHAEHDRNDRVTVMVGAHLLFGAVLGALEQRWSR